MGLATVVVHPDFLERVREDFLILKAYELGDGLLYCLLEDDRFINNHGVVEIYLTKDGTLDFRREADT